ncbi:MAG: hypothetical protein Q8L84_15910, partial [Hyphomonas sp.]|nr:hypothetical protein [Hyphomonas sp.]
KGFAFILGPRSFYTYQIAKSQLKKLYQKETNLSQGQGLDGMTQGQVLGAGGGAAAGNARYQCSCHYVWQG